jgi:hypothetical protein
MLLFLNYYTMYLIEEKNYGEIVSWDDDHQAFDRMLTRIAHSVGEGLMILEI